MLPELVLPDFRVKASKPALIPRHINIYHPGYDKEVVPLLFFPGYDSKEGHLWYDFAHIACAIVSNNQFDGWLSTTHEQRSSITAFLWKFTRAGRLLVAFAWRYYEYSALCDLLFIVLRPYSAVCHHHRFWQLGISSVHSRRLEIQDSQEKTGGIYMSGVPRIPRIAQSSYRSKLRDRMVQ